MVADYSPQLANYWFLILTPFIVLGLLAAIRKVQKEKKERDDWLKGDIRHRRDD